MLCDHPKRPQNDTRRISRYNTHELGGYYYDYNNSGHIVTYYKRPKPDVMEFWDGKEFHEWEIELLQSEGYKLMILKTIDLHIE